MVTAVAYRRRKARQDFDEFAALVATPGNLATGVKLPAPAEVYVSTSSVLAASTVLVRTGTGRDLGGRVGPANQKHHVGRLGATLTVTKKAGAPGTVRLWVRDPAGVPKLIAQG